MSERDALSDLFRAERLEQPPAASAMRGLQDLQASLKAGVAPLPVATEPLRVGFSVATKWLLGGMLAGVAAAGVPVALGLDPFLSADAPPSTSVPGPQDPPAAAPPTLSAGPISSAAEEASAPRAVPRPIPSASAGTASTFAEELRMIRSAKQELDRGESARAEAWLAEHARRFPNGVFQGEREALRVLAACRRGATSDRVRAERFVRENPGSPLVDRITRTCNLRERSPVPVGSSRFPDLEKKK